MSRQGYQWSLGAAGPLLRTVRDIDDILRRLAQGQPAQYVAKQHEIPVQEVRRIGMAHGMTYDYEAGRMAPAAEAPAEVVPFGLEAFGVPGEDPGGWAWQDAALCAQTDPEAFFPEKGGSTRAAKKVCRACPVRADCLQYALEHDERFGIWGGLSERERRALSRAGRPAVSPRSITEHELDRFAELRAKGLSHAQIAGQMGVVERRVYTIARRARELEAAA